MRKVSQFFTLPMLIVFILLFSEQIQSATCISLGTGNWTTTANWSCGAVPTCGDSVIIQPTHSITITNTQNYIGCASGPNIVIFGVLKFTASNRLKLPCISRIYVMPGGSIQPGAGGGMSNYIEICGINVWTASMGTLLGPACLPITSVFCTSMAVLPIKFLNFYGELKNGYTELTWITGSELNSDYFEVERSEDAVSFITLKTLPTKAYNGNSFSILNYISTDTNPLPNISYYRIKQVDKDHNFGYSNIISIDIIKAKNLKFIIYPNPNNGEFIADISSFENNDEVTIKITDITGKLIYNSIIKTKNSGSNKLQIVTENSLSKGTYACTLTLDNIDYYINIVIN
jgi:hypothetical protein